MLDNNNLSVTNGQVSYSLFLLLYSYRVDTTIAIIRLAIHFHCVIFSPSAGSAICSVR